MFKIGQTIALGHKNLNQRVAIQLRCLSAQALPKLKERTESSVNKKESESVAMNLFRGQVKLNQIFPFPQPLNEEHLETLRAFLGPLEKFATEINDPVKSEEQEMTDEKTLQALWELGAFSLQVPIDYGGSELKYTQVARLVEILGATDLGLSVTLAAHQSIGYKGILLYGNQEQKEKYLPRVSNGEFAAFCLTEPSCGSDAASIKTRAVKSADGSHYIMNGSKIWISNGGLAKIYTVFAQTPITDPRTGETKDKISAFIVERDFEGVSNGPPEKKMGIKCSNTTEVFFEDAKIPAKNLLGKEGEGFKIAMNILNNGRFGMAAALSGTMKTCIKKAAEHAANRVQFGKTIDNYGTIQEKIARMAMLQYVCESLAYMVAGKMDMGSHEFQIEAAISKVFSSEAAWFVCDEAIQILGGMGFMKSAGLEKIMRDLRIYRIFEGANDTLRLFIALTGCQYAGYRLKELQEAMKNPASNFGLLMESAAKRASRSMGIPIGSPNFDQLIHPSLNESASLCVKSTELFAQSVESMLIKYRKNIVEEQFILQRLASCAIDIYSMMVVLSRASLSANKNVESLDHELLMTKTWCNEASSRVAHNLNIINSEKQLNIFKNMSEISKNVCKNTGVIQPTPIGL